MQVQVKVHAREQVRVQEQVQVQVQVQVITSHKLVEGGHLAVDPVGVGVRSA